MSADLRRDAVDTIRLLAADAVQRANSGHPGLPMGAAPMAWVLWKHFLRHDPRDPGWIDRDRFVLSAGHGSMLLYALLHLTGYDLPMEEIKRFRQWGSRTPGHPENQLTPGVETTTGPLGQGFANAVGMAMAERFLAARFNRPGYAIVDHHTYGIVSDGDLMEGVTHEAASLAGHLGLGKLILLYDDNGISIDGGTELAFTEDVTGRFEAYRWQVLGVSDGNDTDAVGDALRAAKEDAERPSLIRVRTVIGYGSPNKQGTASAHGSPLGPDEVRATKRNLGRSDDADFHVSAAVRADMAAPNRASAFRDSFRRYAEEHSGPAAELEAWMQGTLPEGWERKIPAFEAGPGLATRAASGKVLDALVPVLPNLFGGSADLTPSNKTRAKSQADFQKASPGGSYVRFGVREHAMGAVCNGLALHGGLLPYCGTFLVFSDYMRPAIRLAALMGLPVVYVFTHDSIGLGEDGPTHQAVEHLMSLRAIPDLTVIRPADANETAEAWRAALRRRNGPTVLALTRQRVETIDRAVHAPADGLLRGAYVLRRAAPRCDLILIATGSEVHLVLEAARILESDGIGARVVSMPSWELFERQSQAYRDRVLPPGVTRRLAVEAGVTLGWERWVGSAGRTLGIDRFGASAPGPVLFEKFGFTAHNVVKAARAMLP